MFSQPHIRSALLSTCAVLLLLAMSVGAPGAAAVRTTVVPKPRVSGPAISQPCTQSPTFSAANFPASPNVDNTWYPLTPGTQYILEGHSNRTGEVLPHEIIFTVTDLTKTVDGVKTWVLWDLDINGGTLLEAELAFQAQDKSGNVWVLGEYPEEYSAGQPPDAPSTWIAGINSAKGGVLVPGSPKVSSTKFLEAYAPPDIIADCGQIAVLGPRNPAMCVPAGCYDTNILEVDETSPLDPVGSVQLKYYAPGIGNFQIGALNDPEGETLVLKSVVKLGLQDCLQARQATKDLDASGRKISSLYAQTVALDAPDPTRSCESTAPTATPVTPTPVTPTPVGAPSTKGYLPLVVRMLTPTLPPAFYDGCKTSPNPASAPNYPVQIVGVDKVAEVVTLKNIGSVTVSLEDWNMCSIAAHKDHDQIAGVIAPGQTRSFPNIGGSPVWNDQTRNDGALYNASGVLVSYWIDQ